MSAEENKTIVRRFFDEIWSQDGNMDVIRSLVHVDWLPFDSALRHIRPRNGDQGIATFARIYRSAFPDLNFTVGEMVAEGEIVVTRFEAQGTHSGEVQVWFQGRSFTLPPTGRTVKSNGVSINRVVNLHVKGNDWYWQSAGLLESLAVAQLTQSGPD